MEAKKVTVAGLITLVGAGALLYGSLGAGPVVTPGFVMQAVVAQDAAVEFEGTKSCKKCHLATEKSWSETSHAKAFDTLKPGNAKEAKEKAKLDPAKDYSTDPACVGCHTVGFGKPGGYAIPAAGDEKAGKAAAKLENVGCEACHGAGSKYSEIFKEIAKSGRKYKVDELHAAGLAKIDASTCTVCHNDKSPTFPGEFDFEKMKEKGVHAHEPLKQREG